jgi:actin-like protein 6A
VVERGSGWGLAWDTAQYSFKRMSTGVDKWEVTDVACPHTTASYKHFSRMDVAADIMHALGRVSDSKYSDAEMGHIPTVTYELPDGNSIEVGGSLKPSPLASRSPACSTPTPRVVRRCLSIRSPCTGCAWEEARRVG